jgi:fucose permease
MFTWEKQEYLSGKSISLQKDFLIFKKIKHKEKKYGQRSRPRNYKDEFIIAIFLYLGQEITSIIYFFLKSYNQQHIHIDKQQESKPFTHFVSHS